MNRPKYITVNVDELRRIIENVPQGELITMTLYDESHGDKGMSCWFLKIYSDSLSPLAAGNDAILLSGPGQMLLVPEDGPEEDR